VSSVLGTIYHTTHILLGLCVSCVDCCDVGAFGTEVKRPPADKRIITTTRSHMTQAVKEAIDACNPTEILRVGGAGHKVSCLLLLLSVPFLMTNNILLIVLIGTGGWYLISMKC